MNREHIKYLLKFISIFLVVSLIADKLIFLTLNTFSDQVYSGQSIGKLNHYLKTKDSVDVLIYGSSRANHHIDPKYLSNSAFNMGIDGCKMAYPTTLLKLLNTDKKQIILFHIGIDYAFDENYLGEDIKTLNIKYNRNDDIKKEIDRLNQNNPLQEIYWSIGYNGMLPGIFKNYFHPNYDYKTYNGFDGLKINKKQQSAFKHELDNSIPKPCDDSYILNPLYDNYLQEIKSFCDSHNKTVIFFTAPTYSDECKTDNQAMQKIMDNMSLTYYDFTDFFSSDSRLELWKDSTHLSDTGAAIFSAEIGSLLEPVLKQLN
ncbi:hypothetical protein [Bizionia arctica]|uniref:SGNH/GDSL hydrolase family protein n=1 Tax=Bizionia arctica TaxID=1495645 RepID=A0A917LJP7_9FLAO|nr:hypothetical protein [Bizionia arctica]GGG33187.1 hypothetical protein GCM10010976_01130 [Bizionia arctica]